MSRIIAFLLLTLPSLLGAQSYLWPTDASPYLTSSFGEYRSRHFHAGLDIKSWNTAGYKVFAVDDGYLWRIRTSNTGYGKVLYQKLSDGRIAVYAHLDRFEGFIEDAVYQRQMETGSYNTDFFPQSDRFPVKKGDIIAYTGNTGTRYPHLHFEIRSADNEPINPLSLGLSIEDAIAPTPQQIVVTPLENEATVNGTPFIQMPRLKQIDNTRYLTEKVTVSGTFGLEIQAYDGVSAVYNKYSIYSAEVLKNDSLLFRFQYDQFSFNVSPLIMIERNYALDREDIGRFQRLYKTEYTQRLPFYRDELDGHLQLPPGDHRLTLKLRDFNGNESTVEIPVTVIPRDNYTVWWKPIDGGIQARIFPADPGLLPAVKLHQVTEDGHLASLETDTTSFMNDTLRINAVPANEGNPAVLRIENPTPGKDMLYPFAPRADTTAIPHTLDWIYTPRGMIVRVKTFQPLFEPLELNIITQKSDTTIKFLTADLKDWYTKPIPTDILMNGTYVLGTPTQVLEMLEDNHTVFRQRNESVLRSKDGAIELHAQKNSLYYPALVWYHNQDAPNEEFHSPIWAFGPRTVPFRNTAQIRIRTPKVSFPKHQLGIYYSEDGEKWNYLPAEFSADSMLIGEILSLEAFTLRRDSLPPEIYLNTPTSSKSLAASSLDRIEMTLRDAEAGIPGSRSIQLLVDGEAVIFEFNPITKILTYRLRHPLASGKHTIQVSAVDAAGNKNEQSYTFTVR
ncbi:MAG: hypothetical protein K9N46_10135 [Candidatus Marinimicrobia bacterium]|nr:hypothetical protein [Candidatus Neomarinimicrobiota bacterium]MCF7829264.1 hypothetical protein [Candidatus Neomarinimicrobiota bacterium]MCF7881083.1 hypothetical protein [Candidatus Neomarinimicrobiota bacterium]